MEWVPELCGFNFTFFKKNGEHLKSSFGNMKVRMGLPLPNEGMGWKRREQSQPCGVASGVPLHDEEKQLVKRFPSKSS